MSRIESFNNENYGNSFIRPNLNVITNEVPDVGLDLLMNKKKMSRDAASMSSSNSKIIWLRD